MNTKELQSFKKKLLELRTELQKSEVSAQESRGTVELDQAKVGRLTRMDAIQAQQMALESSRRRQQQLLGVGAALRRVETDDFGYCLACGEEIDLRRLSVSPIHTHCISCAE